MSNEQVFLILPLQGAVLNDDVKVSSDLDIIKGSYNDKIRKITNLINADKETTEDMLMHMIKSRSNDFTQSPILVYKTKLNDISYFRDCVIISYYLTSVLNVTYWAKVFPKYKIDLVNYMFTKKDRIGEFRVDTREKNNHILVCNKSCTDYICYPLNFNYECNYELDWLKEDSNKEIIKEIIELIYKKDDLSKRFLRALRFFQKAILTEKEKTCFSNEIKSDEILLLHIVLECLLIKNSFDEGNSFKIRKYVSKAININGYKSNNIFNLIKDMTGNRGQYVHEGKYYVEGNDKRSKILDMADEELDDYMHNKDSIKYITNLDLFKIIVAKVWVENTVELSKLPDSCYNEKTWFDKIEKNI